MNPASDVIMFAYERPRTSIYEQRPSPEMATASNASPRASRGSRLSVARVGPRGIKGY